MNHKPYHCNGTRHEIRCPRHKQRSVPVKHGDTIIGWIHFQPLCKRLAYKIHRAYRKFLYYLKFSFLVGAAAAVAAIFMDAAIQTYAVASYGEPSVVRDWKTFLVENQSRPDMLRKIALFESGDKHFDSKGRVMKGKITPDDTGRYQISLRYHQKSAEKMGLDLFDEKDNETYAMYLFFTGGDKFWDASKPCWSRM